MDDDFAVAVEAFLRLGVEGLVVGDYHGDDRDLREHGNVEGTFLERQELVIGVSRALRKHPDFHVFVYYRVGSLLQGVLSLLVPGAIHKYAVGLKQCLMQNDE